MVRSPPPAPARSSKPPPPSTVLPPSPWMPRPPMLQPPRARVTASLINERMLMPLPMPLLCHERAKTFKLFSGTIENVTLPSSRRPLRFGLSRHHGGARLRANAEAFGAALGTRLALAVEPVITRDYESLLEGIRTGG